MSERPIFSRRRRVLAQPSDAAPSAPPRLSRPEEVWDEGYAALLAAHVLDHDADRLDPDHKLRALPGVGDLPANHPVTLRRRAEQSRRAGLALRDAGERMWSQHDDPAA